MYYKWILKDKKIYRNKLEWTKSHSSFVLICIQNRLQTLNDTIMLKNYVHTKKTKDE